jgi:hypothetical protein
MKIIFSGFIAISEGDVTNNLSILAYEMAGLTYDSQSRGFVPSTDKICEKFPLGPNTDIQIIEKVFYIGLNRIIDLFKQHSISIKGCIYMDCGDKRTIYTMNDKTISVLDVDLPQSEYLENDSDSIKDQRYLFGALADVHDIIFN